MGNKNKNLFAALSHYGLTEEEDYLTESFAYLLRLLCERMPDDALRLLNKLSGVLPLHPINSINGINITTQKTLLKSGRVDMAIELESDTLVLVEIKHDSLLAKGQLESYHHALDKLEKDNYRLVLLKRHKDKGIEIGLKGDQFQRVTWYEIHKWLRVIKNADDLSRFFIKEFQNFLEEKNMSLRRVSWEYIQGIPALLGLRNMLEAAKDEVMPDLHLRKTQGWTWVGLYIDYNFFFGVRYEKPLVVVYENNFGYISTTSKSSIDLESKHFFSLTADEQLGVLIDFLKQASVEVERGKAKEAPPEKEKIDQ
jgi:hypothetical protein